VRPRNDAAFGMTQEETKKLGMVKHDWACNRLFGCTVPSSVGEAFIDVFLSTSKHEANNGGRV